MNAQAQKQEQECEAQARQARWLNGNTFIHPNLYVTSQEYDCLRQGNLVDWSEDRLPNYNGRKICLATNTYPSNYAGKYQWLAKWWASWPDFTKEGSDQTGKFIRSDEPQLFTPTHEPGPCHAHIQTEFSANKLKDEFFDSLVKAHANLHPCACGVRFTGGIHSD